MSETATVRLLKLRGEEEPIELGVVRQGDPITRVNLGEGEYVIEVTYPDQKK